MGNNENNRLDSVIADVAYTLDSLIALRNIGKLPTCNECHNNMCEWKPKPGQMVRYNCPHYMKGLDKC